MIVFLFSLLALFQEFPPADTLRVNGVEEPADTLLVETVQNDERREFPTIVPLEFANIPAFQTVLSDSLLRWEQWYNMAERDSYRPGAISYRLGSHGRNDGIIFRGHEIRHRQIFLEDFLMNDPVSGTHNSNLLPLDRMRTHTESSTGIQYQSVSYLNRYYVTKPLTFVNFEETGSNVRRAEAILTQNINRATNLELAYRGNNDDGEYPRNFLSGRQASVTATHYINPNWVGRAMLFYNSFQMGESEGFIIPDRQNFAFIPSNTQAVNPQARSSLRQSLIAVSLFHRRDVNSPVSSTINVYNHRYRRFFYSVQDSTFHRSQTYGISGTNRLQLGDVSLRSAIDASLSILDENRSFSIDFNNWQTVRANVVADVPISDLARLSISGNTQYRSDDFLDYGTGYRLDINPKGTLRFYQSLSIGRVAPTIQHLYWQSNQVSGNNALSSETLTRIEGGISYHYGDTFLAQIRGFYSQIDNPIILAGDPLQFVNGDQLNSFGGELSLSLETNTIEASVSTTLQQYTTDSERVDMAAFVDDSMRILNRASFYLKSYFFDFATFAKIGVSGVFSPNIYRTGKYLPRLDYWDSVDPTGQIPSFYRVDLEASARVRDIFFLLKYENVLDNVGQFGYFETADYPMPGRRFRFGVRVLLRN